jgi:hypothetical protein
LEIRSDVVEGVHKDGRDRWMISKNITKGFCRTFEYIVAH